MRVAAEAKRLALLWGEDAARAETAGWLHDVSAIVPTGRRIRLAEDLGLDVLPEERAFPMIIQSPRNCPPTIVHQAASSRRLWHHRPGRPERHRLPHDAESRCVAARQDRLRGRQDAMGPGRRSALPERDHRRWWNARSIRPRLVYLDYLWQRRATLPVVHPWLVQAYHQTLNKSRTPDRVMRYPGFSGSPSSRSSSSRKVEMIISSAGSAPGHVAEARLHGLADSPENVGHGDADRAGVAAHAAPHAGVDHVQQPGHVEEQGVRRQPHTPFALRPIPVASGGVVKDVGTEDTFLAIADRAGAHAVLAVDAGGELRQERLRFVHPLAEGSQAAISLGGARSHERPHGLDARGGLRETQLSRPSSTETGERAEQAEHTRLCSPPGGRRAPSPTAAPRSAPPAGQS